MHYLQRLATAMQQLESTPGRIANVTVQHDNGCPVLSGKPTCRCVPNIFIEIPGRRIEVMPDGRIRHPAESN